MLLLRYEPSAAYFDNGGTSAAALAALAPQLIAARDEVLADAQLWASGGAVPADKEPLDAGFHQLPERLCAEYASHGAASELGRLKATADRLAATCKSVVVLGIGGSYMGARALLEGCCHPFYNEVDGDARKGRPRVYFEGNNVDNDATTGLLELFASRGEPWGLVVISKSGGTLETAAATRVFLRALSESVGGDHAKLAQRVVPVTATSGKLLDLAKALGCGELYDVPDGVGGRFSVLSAVGLMPAALLGLDVVKLLEGARAMNEHFASAAVGKNAVLDYVGVCHLLEKHQGCVTRILSTWGKRLEATGLWYDQLLAESLGKHERGAFPLTVVNTRDLHSRGQQHQEGVRDKLITNLIVERAATPSIAIGKNPGAHNQDGLDELAAKTLPQVLSAALAGTNQAYAEDRRPTTDLVLPVLDEHSLGQFLQMMMLATVAEGRLIGINPYGQPGVEAYKKNMNAILRK
ncbi:MAG: glucose-6-phosphate isomerase [Lacipirellulaceae bacterium]